MRVCILIESERLLYLAKINKIEYSAVIRYLFLKKNSIEINTERSDICENCAPSMSTIKYFTPEFKRERTSIFVNDHSVGLKEISTLEMVDKVYGKTIDE